MWRDAHGGSPPFFPPLAIALAEVEPRHPEVRVQVLVRQDWRWRRHGVQGRFFGSLVPDLDHRCHRANRSRAHFSCLAMAALRVGISTSKAHLWGCNVLQGVK